MAKGREWKPPGRIEQAFRAEVDRLIDRYFTLPSAAGLGEITERLVEWGQVDRVFRRYAERTASSMVTGVAVQNARTWREAASQSMRGREIYAALSREMKGPVGMIVRATVSDQADLITSLPRKVAQQSQAFIAEQQLRGVRAASIAADLRKRLPHMKRAHIDLIARTGVSSSMSAVIEGRASMLGLNWYEWDTSEDLRVRMSHRKMDRTLVCWGEAPAPEALIGVKSRLGHYHAGRCPNCRCLPNPLVMLSEVSWPHKVYTHGALTRMTKPQFVKIAPGYRLAA